VELARRGHDDSQLSRKQKASEHGQTGGGVPDVRTNNDIAVVAGDRARTSSVGGPERRDRAFVSRISPQKIIIMDICPRLWLGLGVGVWLLKSTVKIRVCGIGVGLRLDPNRKPTAKF